ncbi:hypothetical protein OIU85_001489 [Salix viminalis]|uniref:Phospholipase A2 domain-containing protein n=1 Tax=Salix viminalis TaxID=40686 RepID=A0A9Q0ZXU4_SALVM|nr:hypothetical protein OIU85_001489 [Salix viminalis]
MNFEGFKVNIPWFKMTSNNDLGTNPKPATAVLSMGSVMEKPGQQSRFDIKFWGMPRGAVDNGGGRGNPLRFKPYVSKVPWHTGARAFLSQLFPRYGHYCGPNWSSGKDGGSLLWDKRPIDWLDYCCYCHDIGYDSHDQAELLKADLTFLQCLERPHMATKGDAHVAHVYKTMCITGLKNILIPYRTNLVRLQSGRPLINFEWLSKVKWRRWNL